MVEWHTVGLQKLNELLKPRGIEVENVSHPLQEYKKFLRLIEFRVGLFKPCTPAGTEETVEMGLHNLNFVLDSRGVILHRINHLDWQSFAKFSRDFVMPLRYTVKIKGPWSVTSNPLDELRMKKFAGQFK